MRILIFIALLCAAVQGRGQIYIDSYKFAAAAPSGDLFLDIYGSATAAYSLRKLDKDYTGSAIRVRRSNDNAEQDIGFVSNYLDTASLKTFVGANSGFVVTWYNQSDSSGTFGIRNATQATAGNQPRIVNAGALEYQNGEIAINYTGSVNQTLEVPNSTGIFKALHDTSAATVLQVAAVGTSSNPSFERVFFRTGGGSTSVGVYFAYSDVSGNNDLLIFQANRGVSAAPTQVNNTGNNTFLPNVQNLAFIRIDNDNATAANRSIVNVNNGANLANNVRTDTPSNANSTNNFIIGDGLFGNFTGRFQELIIYSSDKASDRTAMQTNINTFYSIY